MVDRKPSLSLFLMVHWLVRQPGQLLVQNFVWLKIYLLKKRGVANQGFTVFFIACLSAVLSSQSVTLPVVSVSPVCIVLWGDSFILVLSLCKGIKCHTMYQHWGGGGGRQAGRFRDREAWPGGCIYILVSLEGLTSNLSGMQCCDRFLTGHQMSLFQFFRKSENSVVKLLEVKFPCLKSEHYTDNEYGEMWRME